MEKDVGLWSDPFILANVAVHATLLPNRKILCWGRRANPKSLFLADHSLDEHFTRAFLWNTVTRKSERIPDENQPYKVIGTDNNKSHQEVNLFCSGHCLLPDGNVLVAGGHIVDGRGLNQASVYDYKTNKFLPQVPMTSGRWYPSVLTLPDGRALVLSGNNEKNEVCTIPEIWVPPTAPPADIDTPNNIWLEGRDTFRQLQLKDTVKDDSGKFKDIMLPLYPRIHLTPTGRVFMAGPLEQSLFLDLKKENGDDITDKNGQVFGTWSNEGISRKNTGFRDYAPSVLYDTGKIMYVGGGASESEEHPSQQAEIIDLNPPPPPTPTPAAATGTVPANPPPPKKTVPQWEDAGKMHFPRKQFNATVLPDGTVLVTGGFSGSGFNNLDTAVHTAELWNPKDKNNRFTVMAAESSNRCYHSIALLLPDGRVLSAGGGEYGGVGLDQCLNDAQIFDPPYLFKDKETRPTIVNCPSEIKYDPKPFTVTVGAKDVIKRVSLVRFGSVTHCRNMNQSFMWLTMVRNTDSTLTVTPPTNPNVAPPGHYMLFVLSEADVPSEAAIVRIPLAPPKSQGSTTGGTSKPSVGVAGTAQPIAKKRFVQLSHSEHDERIKAEQDKPAVAVGITPLCPYGLAPCWAGAHEALKDMSDIAVVRPVPSQEDSLAFVYLKEDILPDIDAWRGEFANGVNRSYDMRGIEMTLSGVVTRKEKVLTLSGTSTRPEVTLAPFQDTSQIKWNLATNSLKPVYSSEAAAYERLSTTLAEHPEGTKVQVTGTLQKHDVKEFALDVRDFEILDAAAS